jgi:hypothetical protein
LVRVFLIANDVLSLIWSRSSTGPPSPWKDSFRDHSRPRTRFTRVGNVELPVEHIETLLGYGTFLRRWLVISWRREVMPSLV